MELHDFTEKKHCFVAYDMLFLEKSLGLWLCSYKKNKLDSTSGRQSSHGFTFALKYASAVTGVMAITIH
jgi:hypothetical protein